MCEHIYIYTLHFLFLIQYCLLFQPLTVWSGNLLLIYILKNGSNIISFPFLTFTFTSGQQLWLPLPHQLPLLYLLYLSSSKCITMRRSHDAVYRIQPEIRSLSCLVSWPIKKQLCAYYLYTFSTACSFLYIPPNLFFAYFVAI